MTARRKLARLLPIRRLASSVLLFLLLGDLALHVGESFFNAPREDASSTVILGGLATAAHGDESDCPIPGHSSDPFHHHHFPGIIVTEGYLAPSEQRRLIVSVPAELPGSSSGIAHPGRAPPLA